MAPEHSYNSGYEFRRIGKSPLTKVNLYNPLGIKYGLGRRFFQVNKRDVITFGVV